MISFMWVTNQEKNTGTHPCPSCADFSCYRSDKKFTQSLLGLLILPLMVGFLSILLLLCSISWHFLLLRIWHMSLQMSQKFYVSYQIKKKKCKIHLHIKLYYCLYINILHTYNRAHLLICRQTKWQIKMWWKASINFCSKKERRYCK